MKYSLIENKDFLSGHPVSALSFWNLYCFFAKTLKLNSVYWLLDRELPTTVFLSFFTFSFASTAYCHSHCNITINFSLLVCPNADTNVILYGSISCVMPSGQDYRLITLIDRPQVCDSFCYCSKKRGSAVSDTRP